MERIKQMKQELKHMLAQPLLPRGVSARYLTSGIIRDLADRLLTNKGKSYLISLNHLLTFIQDKVLPTLDSSSAIEDAKSLKRKRR
jgi:hypothetical protein